MTTQQFKKGSFVEYRTLITFYLGMEDPSKDNVKMLDGTILLYDGFTVKIGDDIYESTRLRSATTKGWLVRSEDSTSTYQTRPAGVEVTPADGMKKTSSSLLTVSEEDRVVGRIDDVRQAAQGFEVGKINIPAKTTHSVETWVNTEDAPIQTHTLTKEAEQRQTQAAHAAKIARQNRVASMQPPLPPAIAFGDSPQGAEVLMRALNQGTEVPSIVHVDKVPVTSVAKAQPVVVESIMVRTAMGIDWDMGRPTHIRMQDAMERFSWSVEIIESIAEVEDEEVSRVLQAHLMKQGVSKDIVSSAKKSSAKKSSAKKSNAKKSSAKKKPKKETEATTRTKIDWDMSGHWTTRAKRAVEMYGDSPSTLKGICMVEIPAVTKRIKKHLER